MLITNQTQQLLFSRESDEKKGNVSLDSLLIDI